MSVTLHAVVSTMQTASISISGTDTVRTLKKKVGAATDLAVGTFTVSFDSEELTNDEMQMGTLPLEDQSEIAVQVSKRLIAEQQLEKMGYYRKDVMGVLEEVGNTDTKDDGYRKVLEVMCEGGMCQDRDVIGAVLQEAIKKKLIGCVEVLALHSVPGIAVDALSVEGLTPLHVAVSSCNEAAVQLFLDLNADPNARTQEGLTPLHLAVRKDTPCTLLGALLSGCADPNATSENNSMSPLHFAALYNNDSHFEYLLHHGADGTLKDSMGRTPVDIRRMDPFRFKAQIPETDGL
eukprot:TRINITY_DN9758_c0_g1_i1.p1 TRINITY_DN9758_c0_g1~~TRINITY_DN9758_c0_g1_i1.p1  ORF type:complete len:292 (+),score=75.97 TRINITY_DN9758_c0_g1_i1:385-1260(+)